MNTDLISHPLQVGLIGWPVEHSFSPQLHQEFAKAAGIALTYTLLPTTTNQLETQLHTLKAAGYRGVNVTIPHKETVIPLLDEIDVAAKAIGAVNTIIFEPQANGQILSRGTNTDAAGFLTDLTTLGIPYAGRDCLVLGAGGAARAVVYALLQAGGRVTIVARRESQAAQLAQVMSTKASERAAQTTAVSNTPSLAPNISYAPWTELRSVTAQQSAPLIINSTPLGMSPLTENSPWPAEGIFPPGTTLYDLVYNPLTTRLMRQAQAQGHPAFNGLGMLREQAALAFRLWTKSMDN